VSEAIGWPIRIWLGCFALDLAIVLSLGVVLSNQGIFILLVILLLLTIIAASRTRLRIRVSENSLEVGNANIAPQYILKIELLDDQQMRLERGIALDPRAFLAIRFWVKDGIKVYLKDARDPTPYWLISTRKGNEIKKLLNR
jgi:hypothetical protein